MSDEDGADAPSQDGPVALVAGVGALLLAAMAVAAAEPLSVVLLGGAAGAVGLATWAFARADGFADRSVVGGQAAFAVLALVGAALSLAWGSLLTAAGLAIAALMMGGRVYESRRG